MALDFARDPNTLPPRERHTARADGLEAIVYGPHPLDGAAWWSVYSTDSRFPECLASSPAESIADGMERAAAFVATLRPTFSHTAPLDPETAAAVLEGDPA